MANRFRYTGSLIALCMLLSSLSAMGSALAGDEGGTRYYTDAEDSMKVFMQVEPEEGPVGTEVTVTAHILDSGKYITPTNVTVTRVSFSWYGYNGTEDEELKMTKSSTGVYTGEYTVTPEDDDGDLYFQLESHNGKNYDSDMVEFWVTSGYEEEDDDYVERYVSLMMDGYGSSAPGDVRDFTVEVYEYRDGETVPVDSSEPECWYIQHPSDEACEYWYYGYGYGGDGEDGGDDMVDIPLKKGGKGEWTGQVATPSDLTESTTFEIMATIEYDTGMWGTDSDSSGTNFTVDFCDVWYRNITLEKRKAEFELYVADGGEPVAGAEVTCRAEPDTWYYGGGEDDAEELPAQTTDPDGVAFFTVEYDSDVYDLFISGWVTTDEYRQHYKGHIVTPNEYDYGDDDDDYDPYEPHGYGLEVILQQDDEVGMGGVETLEYIAWYTDYYSWDDETEPLGNTMLYYYFVSEDHEDHVIEAGSVRTDPQGAFTLKFTVPGGEAFEGSFSGIDCYFEAPTGEAPGLTEDGKSYSEDSRYIYAWAGYSGDESEFEPDPDLSLDVGDLVAGGDTSVSIDFSRADSGYVYELYWIITSGLEGDFEDWMDSEPESSYYKWGSASHYDYGNAVAGWFTGSSAEVTLSIPPFLDSEQQVLFVVFAGDPETEDYGVNYELVDVKERFGHREETLIGPFITSDGEPVAGATVTVTDGDGDEMKGLTDEFGYGHIEGEMDMGDYEGRVDKGGEEVIPAFGFSVGPSGRVVYDSGTSPPPSSMDSWDLPSGSDTLEPEGEGDGGDSLTLLILALTIAVVVAAAASAAVVAVRQSKKKNAEAAGTAMGSEPPPGPRPMGAPGPRPMGAPGPQPMGAQGGAGPHAEATAQAPDTGAGPRGAGSMFVEKPQLGSTREPAPGHQYREGDGEFPRYNEDLYSQSPRPGAGPRYDQGAQYDSPREQGYWGGPQQGYGGGPQQGYGGGSQQGYGGGPQQGYGGGPQQGYGSDQYGWDGPQGPVDNGFGPPPQHGFGGPQGQVDTGFGPPPHHSGGPQGYKPRGYDDGYRRY